MKRILFYILFLALACIVKAQEDYQPFMVEGKTWVYPPDTNNFYTHDMTCTITGDTTINDVVYKKVMAKGPSGFGVTGEIVYLYWKQDPSYQSSYAYYGAIREKDKKVYFIPRGESSQFLIYDFGLSVGECYMGKGKEMQICLTITDIISDMRYVWKKKKAMRICMLFPICCPQSRQ